MESIDSSTGSNVSSILNESKNDTDINFSSVFPSSSSSSSSSSSLSSNSSEEFSTPTVTPLPSEYTDLPSSIVKDADKVLSNLRNWNQGRRNSKISSSSSSFVSAGTINEYNHQYDDKGDLLFSTSVENIHQAEKSIKRYQQTTQTSSLHSNLSTSTTTYNNTLTNEEITPALLVNVNIDQLQKDTVNLTAKMLAQAKLMELGLTATDILDAQQS